MTGSVVDDGRTHIAVGVEAGRVVLRFPAPLTWAALDPQNAYEIGEAIARAAHEARFPGERIPDGSYLAQQIRARLTEEMRDALVSRVALVLPQLIERRWSPWRAAAEIVDIVLAAAQGKEIA